MGYCCFFFDYQNTSQNSGVLVYYQNTSQKSPANEGMFDRMQMSEQILKIRKQGVTLLCSQFRF